MLPRLRPPPLRQDVVLTAAKKDGALEMGIRSTITNPKYTVVGTLSQAGKVRLVCRCSASSAAVHA